VGAVTEWLHGGAAAAAEGVDPSAGEHLTAFLVDQADRASYEQRAPGSHANDGDPIPRSHEERLRAVALPPLRPAAASYWSSFLTLGLLSGITGHLLGTRASLFSLSWWLLLASFP
jgi:hypothetical protein